MFGRTHPLFFFLSASDCCAELDALHADDSEFKLETESVDSCREMLLPKDKRFRSMENACSTGILCEQIFTSARISNRINCMPSLLSTIRMTS